MLTDNERDQQTAIFKLVLAMRKAQREYYVHRISKSVHRMKKFERDLDAALEKFYTVKATNQLSL